MTENDKYDILTDNISLMIDNACKMVAKAKEKQGNVKTVVYVDNEGNDAVAYVYDFSVYTWKSTDTFDKLARDYLGDASLGTIIAYFNEIAVESEVESGTKIKIPILTETPANQNNMIYAVPELQDNYGVDIAINDEGDFDVAGGDFGTVSGTDNLAQAIGLRLSTDRKNRIRLNAYGIKNTIGDPMAVKSYLTSSIEQTIEVDPRIKEVEEISYETKNGGDDIQIDVTYMDINGKTGSYKGEL